MTVRRWLTLVVLAGSLVGLALWFARCRPSPSPAPFGAALAPPAPQARGEINDRPDQPQVHEQNSVESPWPRSPLGDSLNAPGQSAEEDVKQVLALVGNYRTWLKEVPSGNNREITAQLSGRNVRKVAPLAPDCAAISSQGELLDRWGRAYSFHNLDRLTLEVRSRGADGQLFTPDDVVARNGPGPEFLQPTKR